MSIILGLNINNGGTSASLIKDGRIIAAIEEERLIRVKNTWAFPKNSINYCLNEAGISMKDVDIIAIPLDNKNRLGKEYEKKLGGMDDLPQDKIKYIPHHLCHAYASFFCSGFENSHVIVMDALGDDEFLTHYYFDRKGHKELKKYKLNSITFKNKIFNDVYSPASYYSMITERIGFGEFGEGKTMAYAALGKNKLSKIFWLEKDVTFIDEYWLNYNITDDNIKINLAYRIQKDLEEYIINFIDNNILKKSKLCLSGGTFLNCKTNGIICNKDIVEDLFVYPNSRDSGNSLGAAIFCLIQNNEKLISDFTPYLGIEFSKIEMKKDLEKFGLNYIEIENKHKKLAQLINDDYIVANFQGRLEWGPRALGNRSIFSKLNNKGRLNYVKGREKWRPFGLMVKEDYLLDKLLNEYMLIAVKDDRFMAHIDGTSRIQAVKKNSKYYDLMNELDYSFGIKNIINTSFNSRGVPLVCTPQDAIVSFLRMDIDYMFLGNYLVSKENSFDDTHDPYDIKEVMIEPTNYCNLNCLSCSYTKSKKNNKELSFDEFKIIINKLKKLKFVTFCGLGEPLFNKELVKMIDYLITKKINFRLDTNGLLINDLNIDKILEANEIVISFDTTYKKHYEEYRVNGKYELLLEKVKFLLKHKNKIGSKSNIVAQILVTSYNEDKLKIEVKRLKEIGFNSIKIKSIFVNNEKYNYMLPKSKKFLRYKKYPELIRKTNKCKWSNKLLINSDGEVMPCCFMEHDSNESLGNLLEMSLKDLNFDKKLYNLKNKNKNKYCRNCQEDAMNMTTILNRRKKDNNKYVLLDNLLLLNPEIVHCDKHLITKPPFIANLDIKKETDQPYCFMMGYEENVFNITSNKFKKTCRSGNLIKYMKPKYKECEECKYFFACLGTDNDISPRKQEYDKLGNN